MDEVKAKKARLVKLLIEKGWSPPPPSTEAMYRILDDMETQTKGTLDLAPRELQVVELAAQGHTLASTASQLGISPEMAKDYFARARRRLGAKTQAQAVAIAYQKGILA